MNKKIKSVIGIILMSLILPIIGGLVRSDQGDTFIEGFKLGLLIDGIGMAFIAIVLLFVWLFGGFDND